METTIGIKDIRIAKLDKLKNLYVVSKTIEEIEQLITNIHTSLYDSLSEFNLDLNRTLLIINETDFEFIKEYININSIYLKNGFQDYRLFGMQVRKMKQKGFIFAYE